MKHHTRTAGRRARLFAVVAAGVFISHGLAEPAALAPAHPVRKGLGPLVAVAVLPSGTLVALESHGGIYRLVSGGTRLEPLTQNLGYYDPIDLDAGSLDNQETFFVSLASRASYTSQTSGAGFPGKLIQYSMDGKELHTWFLPHQGVHSIALDASGQVLYLGNSQAREIYTVDLKNPKNSAATFLMSLPNLVTLGAMAFDGRKKRLFVSDAVGGKLYVVDLQQRKTRALTSSLGLLAALAYDEGEGKLYIADAGRRRIWVLRPDAPSAGRDAPSAKTTTFFSPAEFREPRGLAVDARHRVWVADYGARAVFSLSALGQVVSTYRD